MENLRRSACSLIALATAFAVMPAAHAERTRPHHAKIAPGARRAARTGLMALGRATGPTRAPIVITLNRDPDEADIASLGRSGVQLSWVDGRVVRYRRWLPAFADDAALDALERNPRVARVDVSPMYDVAPMERSAELIRLADARGAHPALDLLTGAGVTIGVIDGLVDVFHPSFFHADAGYYDWLDLDGDGVFSPDLDAIDLDHDGVASAAEAARAVIAATLDLYSLESLAARSPTFDPGVDWVFLDTNGNDRRDFGPASFGESEPAYGEPIFVPDDLNRNGVIDLGERFVRLGTSKFKGVYVGEESSSPRVYRRGIDLIEAPIRSVPDRPTHDAMHATGVASIMVGDVPLAGRRRVGIAPNADLLEATRSYAGQLLPTDAQLWLLGEGANVMLYEFAPWYSTPLDGSDVLSAVIDESTEQDGVVHTCPVGNQGSTRKHASATIAPGATVELPFEIPAKTKQGKGPLQTVSIDVHLRGGDANGVWLIAPNEEAFALVDSGGAGVEGPGALISATTTERTPRGTHWYSFLMSIDSRFDSPPPIPVGQWKLRIRGGDEPTTAHLYLADSHSGWGAGAAWDPAIASEQSVIGVPSTADHCVAVGAVPGYLASEGEWWKLDFYSSYFVPQDLMEGASLLRAYSAIGPRIDGMQKPDLVAPDNPWVAMVHDREGTKVAAYGGYGVFGGTSGASPHATGAAALLAQAGIRGAVAADALRSGAAGGPTMGALPNASYGYGQLDVAKALGVADSGTEPSFLVMSEPKQARRGESVELTVVPTPEQPDDTLEATWDVGYDGTWDHPYAAAKTSARIRFDEGATVGLVKVRVRNASGRFAEKLVRLPIVEATGCACNAASLGPIETGMAFFGFCLLLLLTRAARPRPVP